MSEYTIYKSRNEESKEGWCWVYPLPEKFYSKKGIALIKNGNTENKIICELRLIDVPYKGVFNEKFKEEKYKISIDEAKPTIILNEHYRRILLPQDDISKSSGSFTAEIEITSAKCYHRITCFFTQHPNPLVRLNYCLAIILCIIGLIFPIFDLLKSLFNHPSCH